ncbi:oxidoreductase [Halomonas alkalisoli]|uniref:oxidoreductase n=1 Tax=Halomonas alkalisoli TaxID=2907158 RepID=UPI001F29FC99|nr:hypothetical protein [Halomonas alkalisoli]MCE9683557.1 hypothetical protein [Halomonas alkalisoli]
MLNLESNKNIFFLPVNTGFSTNQTPDSRCVEFYRERSGHGLHCAIVGNVVVPEGVGSNSACSKISKNPAWNFLAEAISERGAKAGIQLASCWPGYKGMQNFIAKSVKHNLAVYRNTASSITECEVIAIFDSLKLGTDLATAAGFRHIQVHAAHGYLFNLIIDSRFSRHSNLAMAKLREWTEQLAELEIETSIRLSLATGATELDDSEPHEPFDRIAGLGFNYLDLSSGFYNLNKRLIYPSSEDLLSRRIAATVELASRHPQQNFIVSGKSLIGWNKTLPKNVHIGICRDLIANPNYLREFSDGCQNKMKCHYHSRGADFLTCGKWDNP